VADAVSRLGARTNLIGPVPHLLLNFWRYQLRLLASLTREFGLETELELSRPHVTRAIDFAFDL
jgi:hypothetical protein